ncbi:Polygalacturonase-1 non-catalytic subunit beta like [Melia azedarach]|uniref:Polygalacturonase-1 non-catalytic subunit beta like n=1 Tax=Melia azedarach TaxID=155640 RepID=A0ACC1XK46_MELAZ|nr:Polygalacturonase-1 non-catalytic subunit beta like [Melia azedarach]
MHKQHIIKFMGSLFFLLLLSSIHVDCAVAVAGVGDLNAKENPFTPKAYLSRFWDKNIHNDLPKSSFLLSKSSPLNTVDSANFAKACCSENPLYATLHPSGETAQGAVDKFKSYGKGGNVPEEYFKNYGDGVNGGVESFTSYNLHPNVARDDFNSYAKNSNSEKVYGSLREFKDYTKNGVAFAVYAKERSAASATAAARVSGNMAKRWMVEPGKFFRESMLKKGTVMPMPDIEDKMPKRSFLPRSIASKLPFTSSKVSEIKQIFHAIDNSTMDRIIKDALSECELAPSRGETKRCVGSAEDMIDFATSVLGTNVAMWTTENVQGSKQNIMIGSVKGINGGKVTESASCHQSLYPYLLYYCHSVPKVRVYEADILNPKTKEKINHGVAICHLDTSTWSATHGTFMTLGSGPGRIEVCHWIFENDLTWTVADPN